MALTKQIGLMQNDVTKSCASETRVFSCERACTDNIDSQITALEWVSKKILGTCPFYNFKFTRIHHQIRAQLSLPKTGLPFQSIFGDITLCSYQNLNQLRDPYAEWAFDMYRRQSGKLITLAFNNVIDAILDAAQHPDCVESEVIDCSLIEPANLDTSARIVCF